MFSKKKRQHGSADLSEQAMSDSLRAAQVIFQRHTESQASLKSTSAGSNSQPASQTRVRKTSHGTPMSRSTQPGSIRSSHNVNRSTQSSLPSNHSSQQLANRPVSPLPSSSAHAAAAVAHMAMSRELDQQQEELLALTGLPQALKSGTTSSRIAQEFSRSKNESLGNHSSREKLPMNRSVITPSSSATSSIPKLSVSQAPSSPQSHLEVQHLPNKRPPQTAYITNAPIPATTSEQVNLKKSESRTLAGRIPPPDIYFEAPGIEVDEIQQDSDNREDDIESYNRGVSSSSFASSSSALSFVTGVPSFADDEVELDSEDQELKSDAGDYVGSELESFEYESSSGLPWQTLSATSLPSEQDDVKSFAKSVKTNATYSTLNRIGHGNVTYQGTLPDLIPNHTRRTRIDKIRTRLFGSKNRPDAATDPSQTRSSVTADEEGRPVVTTNHNLRFKTTMRGHGHHSSNDSGKGIKADGDPLDKTITAEGIVIDSDDDDTDSVGGRDDDKRRKRRTARLKRRLKHTAAPYTHHLHHHETRHRLDRKGFNEDKPWKSHNDVGFVTPAERKRYEGMWVSNRCLYLELLPWWASVISGQSAPPVKLPEDGLILNLVVKDIWARSNLPNDLLRQIYEKVDTRQDGTLDRKSFIVGMWLVDQCLYGRKLPREINQQVWDSVDKYVVNVINSTAMKHMGKNKKKLMKQEIKNIKKDIKNVHL